MKMNMFSHAKRKWETYQQKVKKKAGKDDHFIQEVAIAP